MGKYILVSLEDDKAKKIAEVLGKAGSYDAEIASIAREFGIRYKLARTYGMHVGIDFAWSNNREFAFYLIVGTAWNK